MKYPEIKALNNIYIKHQVEIRFSTTEFLAGDKDYCAVTFKLGTKEFNFFVEDEYDDIQYDYPLLNLCLVLRELEYYIETDDYLLWCKERSLDEKNTAILSHYKNLGKVYREVEKIIGNIDSQISDWDFEMGSGASWELRKKGLK